MVYNTFSLHELPWFQKFNLEFVSHEPRGKAWELDIKLVYQQFCIVV